MNKIGIYTAIISFIIGTIFFLCFFYTGSGIVLLETGIIFIFIAGIVNTVVLFKLLKEFINNKEKRRKILITSIIILLNIPIAAIYFHFVMIEFAKAFENL